MIKVVVLVNLYEQVPLSTPAVTVQLIPAGLLVMVPLPDPAASTVNVAQVVEAQMGGKTRPAEAGAARVASSAARATNAHRITIDRRPNPLRALERVTAGQSLRDGLCHCQQTRRWCPNPRVSTWNVKPEPVTGAFDRPPAQELGAPPFASKMLERHNSLIP